MAGTERYFFVRAPDGKLIPAPAEEEREPPSADDLLAQFREEKARTAETLRVAGAAARVLSRGLRQSQSQQRLHLVLGGKPAPK
jgi:hypothetical protein